MKIKLKYPNRIPVKKYYFIIFLNKIINIFELLTVILSLVKKCCTDRGFLLVDMHFTQNSFRWT